MNEQERRILWPECEQPGMVLGEYLRDVAERIIREHVHGDTSEAEEVAGALPSP